MIRTRSLAGCVALVAAVIIALLPTESAAQRKVVGLALPEPQNPFYVAMEKAITDRLKERGIDVKSVAADGDVSRQINGINDLIAAKVDLLLVSPVDVQGPAQALKAANDAGIPVFMVARKLLDQYQDLWKTFVGVDLYESGRLKGQWMAQNVPGGKVAMLLGPPGAHFALEQARGFKEEMGKAGNTFRLAFEQTSTQTRENGLKLAEDAITAHPDLAVIYASNDDLALGAVQAVKAAGKLGQVRVLGLNGSPPAAASVAKGEMAMTIALNPRQWGQLAADVTADYLLAGKQPKRDVWYPQEVVTKANALQQVPPPLRKQFGLE